MTPADHWHDNGDGTAWLVFDDHAVRGDRWWDSRRYMSDLGRPCDTCGGFCRLRENAADSYGRPCPDCDGTGRHTFDVEVECSCACHRLHSKYPGLSRDALGQCKRDGSCVGGTLTYRASIVPGMVLPLVAIDQHNTIGHYIVQTQPSGRCWELDNTDFPVKQHGDSDITLPAAAAPGIYAVKLRIHP